MSAAGYQGLRGERRGLVDRFYRGKRGGSMQRLVVSLFLIYLLQVALQFREAGEVRRDCS